MTSTTGKADLSGLRIDHDRSNEGSETKSKKPIIIGAIVLVVLVASYVVFQGTFAAVPEVEVATVSLTHASSGNAVLTASGYVVAQQKAAIASKATGRLVFLGAEEGDKVKKGQIIARIEDQDVVAALEQARANHDLALADFDDAKQSLERTRTMQASGLSSQAELDAVSARFKRVQASIRVAEATVHSAEVSLENTRIRAPFNGTVLTKNANVGEVVAPFAAGANSRAAVVTIADMSSLEVEADVSESNIIRVTAGAPCEIILDAYPNKRYQGFVHKLVPTADRAKATVMTKIRFKERDERVLPEMSAKVTFLSKEVNEEEAKAPPRLTVPSGAVATRNDREIVLLVQDDALHEKTIRTGGRMGDRVIIAEGLAQGDRVVLRPDPSLTDGMKIKIKP